MTNSGQFKKKRQKQIGLVTLKTIPFEKLTVFPKFDTKARNTNRNLLITLFMNEILMRKKKLPLMTKEKRS